MGEWAALQQSPFFPLWACATIDEILSSLHERFIAGRGPGDRSSHGDERRVTGQTRSAGARG